MDDEERDFVTVMTLREHIGLLEDQRDAKHPKHYEYYIDAFERVLEYFTGERSEMRQRATTKGSERSENPKE